MYIHIVVSHIWIYTASHVPHALPNMYVLLFMIMISWLLVIL